MSTMSKVMVFFVKPSKIWGMFFKYFKTGLWYQKNFDKTNGNYFKFNFNGRYKIRFYFIPHNFQVTFSRSTFAGTPPTNALGGTDRITSEFAATTAPSPMVTPFKTVAFIPIKTLSPIVMGTETLLELLPIGWLSLSHIVAFSDT